MLDKSEDKKCLWMGIIGLKVESEFFGRKD